MSDRKQEIKSRLYDLRVEADKLKVRYESALAPLSQEFNTLTEELKGLDKVKEVKEETKGGE